ncbi:hypothetical protein AA0242T_1957 [Acetobacter aceti NRIC 0242]|nr:hypothetical protein AA0242T_1957 [Acetobacter aceti NRIC 0242]
MKVSISRVESIKKSLLVGEMMEEAAFADTSITGHEVKRERLNPALRQNSGGAESSRSVYKAPRSYKGMGREMQILAAVSLVTSATPLCCPCICQPIFFLPLNDKHTNYSCVSDHWPGIAVGVRAGAEEQGYRSVHTAAEASFQLPAGPAGDPVASGD